MKSNAAVAPRFQSLNFRMKLDGKLLIRIDAEDPIMRREFNREADALVNRALDAIPSGAKARDLCLRTKCSAETQSHRNDSSGLEH